MLKFSYAEPNFFITKNILYDLKQEYSTSMENCALKLLIKMLLIKKTKKTPRHTTEIFRISKRKIIQ